MNGGCGRNCGSRQTCRSSKSVGVEYPETETEFRLLVLLETILFKDVGEPSAETITEDEGTVGPFSCFMAGTGTGTGRSGEESKEGPNDCGVRPRWSLNLKAIRIYHWPLLLMVTIEVVIEVAMEVAIEVTIHLQQLSHLCQDLNHLQHRAHRFLSGYLQLVPSDKKSRMTLLNEAFLIT